MGSWIDRTEITYLRLSPYCSQKSFVHILQRLFKNSLYILNFQPLPLENIPTWPVICRLHGCTSLDVLICGLERVKRSQIIDYVPSQIYTHYLATTICWIPNLVVIISGWAVEVLVFGGEMSHFCWLIPNTLDNEVMLCGLQLIRIP